MTGAPDIAIDVEGLTKSFAGRTVVRDLSLRVQRGSVYGLAVESAFQLPDGPQA